MTAVFILLIAVANAQDVFLARTPDAKTDFQMSDDNPVWQPEATPETRRLQQNGQPTAATPQQNGQPTAATPSNIDPGKEIEIRENGWKQKTFRVSFGTGFNDGIKAGVNWKNEGGWDATVAWAKRLVKAFEPAGNPPGNRRLGDPNKGTEMVNRNQDWTDGVRDGLRDGLYTVSTRLAMENHKGDMEYFQHGYMEGFCAGFKAVIQGDLKLTATAATTTTQPTR